MEQFLSLNSHYSNINIKVPLQEFNAIISKDYLQLCANQDLLILDFLYKSYKKLLNGVILNIEKDFNPQLEISTFLGSIFKVLESKFIVLIICGDENIVKWHYYLSMFSSSIKIITSECLIYQDEIIEDEDCILLVNNSNLKPLDSFKDFLFNFVIIENFDEIATKLVIKRMQGMFNIGITFRNFYTNPDQKLVWNMLNWANPGCVGKLIDFYEVDDENFQQFRDNYKEWWFRLTWSFCDSFIKPTLEEKGQLSALFRDWAKNNNLNKFVLNYNNAKPKTIKRKSRETPTSINKTQKEKKGKKMTSTNEEIKMEIEYKSSESSNETIIYALPPELSIKKESLEEIIKSEPFEDKKSIVEETESVSNITLFSQTVIKSESEKFFLKLCRPDSTSLVELEETPICSNNVKKDESIELNSISDGVDDLIAEVMDIVKK